MTTIGFGQPGGQSSSSARGVTTVGFGGSSSSAFSGSSGSSSSTTMGFGSTSGGSGSSASGSGNGAVVNEVKTLQVKRKRPVDETAASTESNKK